MSQAIPEVLLSKSGARTRRTPKASRNRTELPRLRLENRRRRLAILSFRYENVRSHHGNDSRVSGFSGDRRAAFAQTDGNAPLPWGRASFSKKNVKKS